ncbi:acyl-CoA dehydrogenase family protein, partial [Roseibium sp.]|uniref:acyl-CoA dehydrogenase family protein n=1 Tax=Roseibium sp. TaxID=1936156 RepID=UPI003D153396
MDFTISPEIADIRDRIAAFVETHLLPLESDPAAFDPHENIALDVLEQMREKARAEGLWCVQLKRETGGLGLGKVGMAVCYEAMNRSIFGPVTFNSSAPDDGNMLLLEAIGTEDQKARWLKPVVEGKVRSAFVMTEPHPGAGSDPGMMQTRAVKDGDAYIVSGRKWFITGAEDAAHFILVARTSDDERRGHTAFLFHRDDPGWEIVRRIPIMGPEEHGGHCELRFDGLRIPAENVLLEEGRGMKVTQTRLGPARLTHCMRWLGLSKRCVEIARA